MKCDNVYLFSEWNTSPNGAKVDGESLYWSPLLISLIAVTAILAIVILISFVVRRRGGALKGMNMHFQNQRLSLLI